MSNKKIMSDYIRILQYAYETYDILEKENIKQSIKRVVEKYREMMELEEIPKKYCESIKKYIDFINTYDEENILKQESKLLYGKKTIHTRK
jgi:hypothetical protein